MGAASCACPLQPDCPAPLTPHSTRPLAPPLAAGTAADCFPGGRLTGLRQLSLYKLLDGSGPLPASVAQCPQMRALGLQIRVPSVTALARFWPGMEATLRQLPVLEVGAAPRRARLLWHAPAAGSRAWQRRWLPGAAARF